MRRVAAGLVLAAALLAGSACSGGDESPEPAGESPPPAGGGMSNQEYCQQFAPAEILPLAQAYTVRLEEAGAAFESGDQAELDAALGALREDTDQLTSAVREAAGQLADPEFTAVLLRIADEFDDFVAEVSELDLDTYEDPDSMPTGIELQTAMQEAEDYCR